MEVLDGRVNSMIFRGMLFCMFLMLSFGARADIYKCTAAGAVSYQETPCAGAHVQTTHIETRSSEYFEGCFSTAGTRYARSIEVQPNGAGTYRLIDESNPLGTAMVLKQATHEQLLAVSAGLHLKITDGLSRNMGQTSSIMVYSSRYGSRYIQRINPTVPAITPASLYGVYRGFGSEGQSITFFYTGGTPQVMDKIGCPHF